ncbi:MAG TPA: hypothetical protein DCQ31_03995 [Bacteroidales bacterium]|nr:hypothetical protein [Bacteroidales bacterium]
MKNLFIVVAVVAASFLFSCKQAENTEAKVLTIEELFANADEFVGKDVQITGTVDHVCKHGGRKMFLLGETEDARIKITSAEDMLPFAQEWVGSDVEVVGTLEVLNIDEAYLTEWEAELEADTLAAESTDTAVVAATEGTEHKEHTEKGASADMGTHNPQMDQIIAYRQQLKDEGKEKLSFYSIVYKTAKPIIKE